MIMTFIEQEVDLELYPDTGFNPDSKIPLILGANLSRRISPRMQLCHL